MREYMQGCTELLALMFNLNLVIKPPKTYMLF